MSKAASLLLLDLDGVVIYETTPPETKEQEILLLHDKLQDMLVDLDCPIVVLTHRSRREAHRILAAAGVIGPSKSLFDVIAAEDLLLAAMRAGNPVQLLRRGLCKSWILPVVEARHGVQRDRMAFIDDRIGNLDALQQHGVGLVLHAPSGFSVDGSHIVSFNFMDAVEAIRRWWSNTQPPGVVTLESHYYDIAPWRRTGIHTRKEGRHLFNAARIIMQSLRRTLTS